MICWDICSPLTNIDHMGSQWNLTGILIRPLGEPIQSRHATAIADVVPSLMSCLPFNGRAVVADVTIVTFPGKGVPGPPGPPGPRCVALSHLGRAMVGAMSGGCPSWNFGEHSSGTPLYRTQRFPSVIGTLW